MVEHNYKQIEDIIDARKLLGQYNVWRESINYRYAYSSSAGANTDRFVRFDDNVMVMTEGEIQNGNSIKHTDSEITVVRVRCDNLKNRSYNKWDLMQDIAIPGDGTHLGDSPSLVNLATLVHENLHCEGDEYLVPLSSWDPCFKVDADKVGECSSSLKSGEDLKNFIEIGRRPSLAERISKFIRKHCKKQKSINGEESMVSMKSGDNPQI